jgi:hypothetical protein
MSFGYCSLSSSLTRKSYLDNYFLGTFNISSLNQIEPKIHHHDGLTLYYTLE